MIFEIITDLKNKSVYSKFIKNKNGGCEAYKRVQFPPEDLNNQVMQLTRRYFKRTKGFKFRDKRERPTVKQIPY